MPCRIGRVIGVHRYCVYPLFMSPPFYHPAIFLVVVVLCLYSVMGDAYTGFVRYSVTVARCIAGSSNATRFYIIKNASGRLSAMQLHNSIRLTSHARHLLVVSLLSTISVEVHHDSTNIVMSISIISTKNYLVKATIRMYYRAR
jgi:hypothetical protein